MHFRFPPISKAAALAAAICVPGGSGLAAEPANAKGREIYQQLCLECHGETGAGDPDNAVDPLYGNRSIAALTRRIERTMPEDDEDLCVGEDAAAVAEYIYHAFYSEQARARLDPPQRDLTRLTVPQFKNSVADVAGHFLNGHFSRPPDAHGLKMHVSGIHTDSDNKNKFSGKRHHFEKTTDDLIFDLRREVGDEPLTPESDLRADIQGVIVAADTGTYEFLVRTAGGFRLWVNESDKGNPALVDGWVVSGTGVREESATIELLGGRAYPIRMEAVVSPKDENATFEVLWKKPGGVLEPVPADRFHDLWNPPALVVTAPFPPDDASYGYERGSSISKAWFEAVTKAAVETADFVGERLNQMAGTKSDDGDRERKIREFCAGFVATAFRRPLTDEQRRIAVDERLAGAENLEEGVRRVVIYALTSPHFLYPELPDGDPPDSHDVAARLALVLWDSVPDKPLAEAAARGELITTDKVREQAARMLQDPRAKAKMHGFFHHWLEMDRAAKVAKSSELFPEFSAEVMADLRTSLDLFLDQVVWGGSSDFRQLLLADYLMLNPRLAPLYGRQVEGDGFRKVPVADENRSGVITHPYLLASLAYHDNTSPIHRGVFLTRHIVGRSLKPPPEAIEFTDADFDPTLTMREKVADLTKAKSCMACHATINPLGFSLESFDAIGRFRIEDNDKPVDTRSEFTDDDGEAMELTNARDVAEFAAASEQAQRGFIRQLFHHAVKQTAASYGPDTDDRLYQRFSGNGFNIRELLVGIAEVAALEGTPEDPTVKNTAAR